MTRSLAGIRSNIMASLQIPRGFEINEVPSQAGVPVPSVEDSAPDLGPLRAFSGTFVGRGFNTIFRPQNPLSPTKLDNGKTLPDSDNILELNLTVETLAFPDPDDDHPLGAVPNRGAVQRNITLGGVRYLQTITDVIRDPKRDPKNGTPIHLEPGLWVIVEATEHPAVSQRTVARMASIPHGTTVNAQGKFFTVAGGPQIDTVDITPFVQGDPSNRFNFPSLMVATAGTARIPQDLSIAPEITQAVLKNPNLLLQQHINGQNIVSTDVMEISTTSATVPGGGTANIGFLVGDAAGPNAVAAEMSAIFWVETVETQIKVGPLKAGESRQVSPAVPAGAPAPVFSVTGKSTIANGESITVRYPQIQYTQNVSLNFKTLTWPHVSVATLVPLKPIPWQL
jgi:hypothetical protein